MWDWIRELSQVLITYFSVEGHMTLLFGIVIGIILGGAGAFIYLSVTGQLALKGKS